MIVRHLPYCAHARGDRLSRGWACALRVLCLAFVLLGVAGAAPARAQMAIIRDTEIEHVLGDWLTPVLKSAGMSRDQVNLVIVSSPEINAFVAGGSNIFLYTGLLREAENPGEVIGVMAHELGHIQGGHLVRGRDELAKASYQSILAAVVGIGVGAIGGGGDAAAAISAAGSGAARSGYLSFSRTQESSADQAALRYFETAGFSPYGLVTFMEKLEGQELLPASRQNEYMRTHPVTRDRVAAMRAGLNRSTHANAAFPPQWQAQFDLMKAKIIGFEDPGRAISLYSANASSPTAQYALAIADYRQGNMQSAIDKMDRLIAADPSNPYFYEMRAQIQLDDGRMKDAIDSYGKTLGLMPDAALARIDMAHAMVESAGYDRPAQLKEAEAQLKRALTIERKTPKIHRLLATIYGRLGNEPKAQVELAEEAILLGKYGDAKRFAALAQAGMEKNGAKGSGDWLHLQDVLQYLSNKKDTKE